MHRESQGSERSAERLTGWKAIAQHFGRTQSTVRRWAATGGLPVYRAAGEKGLSIYAYTDELDAWLTRQNATTDISPAPSSNKAAAKPKPAPQSSQPAVWFSSVGLGLILAAVALLASLAVTPGNHETGESGHSTVRQEVPPDAQELFLQGTYHWNRRSPEGITAAIDVLNQAIELHPEYAEAYAGLAMTYNLARQYSDMSGWKAYPNAEMAAWRALELNPSLDQAQAALAFIEFHWHWRPEAGLARFERALQLNPDSANTLMWYASALILAGRPEEALPIINHAQARDPDSSAVLNIKAQSLFYSGQTEQALELIAAMIAEDPTFAWAYYSRYMTQIAQGDYAGYLDSYARLGDLIGVPRYRAAAEAGAAALAEDGVETMAMAMFEVEKEYYERGEALAWDLARHFALIANAEEALVLSA